MEHSKRNKILYFISLFLGILPAVICMLLDNNLGVILLFAYVIVFKPLADSIYLVNRKLYSKSEVWKHYPFWSRDLMHKLYFD